ISRSRPLGLRGGPAASTRTGSRVAIQQASVCYGSSAGVVYPRWPLLCDRAPVDAVERSDGGIRGRGGGDGGGRGGSSMVRCGQVVGLGVDGPQPPSSAVSVRL